MPADEVAYRPLSGFAVAGFIVSALFAVLVVATTIVALVQGIPFFFPFWLMLLPPAGGLVLSLLGQQQIRNSEGTRAGLVLARAGVWISVFTGLGYFSYYYVTGLAIISQANNFLLVKEGADSGFFPRLEKSDDPVELRSAYLLTLPATARGGMRPEDAAGMTQVHDQPSKDGGVGRLTVFSRSQLVRVFNKAAQAAGPIVIEPLGVNSWGYEANSYKVVRNYRVRAPEVELEMLVPVQSTEGEKAGQVRQWFVGFSQIQIDPSKRKSTPLGDGLRVLRQQSNNTLSEMLARFNKGEPCPEFRTEDTNWDRALAGKEPRAALQKTVVDLFKGHELGKSSLFPPPHDAIGDWAFTRDGKLVLYHYASMPLPATADHLGGNVDLLLETTSRQPLTLADIPSAPAATWDVSAIRVERIGLVDLDLPPEQRQQPPKNLKRG
jgi:hypothetical protein